MKRIVKVYAVTRQGDEVLVGTTEASVKAVQKLIGDYLNSFAIRLALSDLGFWVGLVHHDAYSSIKLIPCPGSVRIFCGANELCTCEIDCTTVANTINVSLEEAKSLLESLVLEKEDAFYSVEYIFKEEQKTLPI